MNIVSRTAGRSLARCLRAAGLVAAISGLSLTLQGVSARALAEECRTAPGKLGVSRVVEIDTTRGPRFGQQYPDNDFLREGEIVLTFDDGPQRRHTRMVLEALRSHCTRATFFMVGQMAATDPEGVREVARAGHTIALHTWSHRNLRATGSAQATREIELGLSAVHKALGDSVAPIFRFPYLADSQPMLQYLSSRNIAVLSVDVDSKDFRTRDPREMQRTLMTALAPKRKGILLFHDIQVSTALGIRSVLDELAARGYKVVHVMAKEPARTEPSYDALAEAEISRRHRVVAATPMAQRSVVWPMTPPGVPVDAIRPHPGSPTASAAGGPARAAVRPASAERPQAVPVIQVAPINAPPPVTQPAPAQERPRLRGTTDDDDWSRKVFVQ